VNLPTKTTELFCNTISPRSSNLKLFVLLLLSLIMDSERVEFVGNREGERDRNRSSFELFSLRARVASLKIEVGG